MHLWIVSELYFPETTSTGHFLTGIAEGLASQYDVNVVCSQPTYSARGMRAPVSEVKAGANIFRAYSPGLDRNVILFRFLNLFCFSLAVFWRLIWRLTPSDVVIVVTNPPTLPYLVSLACRVRRTKCVLLVHDVYPEVLFATGVMRENGLLANWFKYLSRRLYRSMSAVVVLGRDMERLIRHALADAVQRIEVITNFADVHDIRPQPHAENSVLQRLGFADRFVVQYSGNMGRTHGLESILTAASELQACSDIRFLMIGEGARRDWLAAQIAEKRLSNVVMLPFQDRSVLCESLNAADVSIISFLPGMSGISVPSRMYNVFATGKPVVAVTEDDSELATVIKEERIGWVVPPKRPDLLAEVIRRSSKDPMALSEMGRRARQAAESRYSLEKIVSKYCALVESLKTDASDCADTNQSSV